MHELYSATRVYHFDFIIGNIINAHISNGRIFFLFQIGVVEYLFPLAFLLSGPDDFVKSMKKRINALANNQILNTVVVR